MKTKFTVWGGVILALLAAFLLLGCDDGNNPSTGGPEGAFTPTGWTTGVELSAKTGNVTGEILYSLVLATTSESGTVTHTGYCVEGNVSTAAAIIAAATEPYIMSGLTAVTDQSATLVPGKTYSLVVVAECDDLSSDAHSAVVYVTAKAPTQLKIAVTNSSTPTGIMLVGANLADENDKSEMVATAMALNPAVIEFKVYDEDGQWYMGTEDFVEPGQYYIVLQSGILAELQANNLSSRKEHWYVGENGDEPILYDFTKTASATLSWDLFDNHYPEDVEADLVVTITDAPETMMALLFAPEDFEEVMGSLATATDAAALQGLPDLAVAQGSGADGMFGFVFNDPDEKDDLAASGYIIVLVGLGVVGDLGAIDMTEIYISFGKNGSEETDYGILPVVFTGEDDELEFVALDITDGPMGNITEATFADVVTLQGLGD